jgi:hypothetical protein
MRGDFHEQTAQEGAATISDSQSRWSMFIEILKINIGLAAALLGAFAVVFSDPTKIPDGWPKWILIGVSLAALLALSLSLIAIIKINSIITDHGWAFEDASDASFEDIDDRARRANTFTLGGFSCLVLSGTLIVLFLGIRVLSPPSSPPSVADELARFRQEQTASFQGTKDAFASGLAGIADQIRATDASSPAAGEKGSEDLTNKMGELNTALQAKIAVLEKRQADLEQQLQSLRSRAPSQSSSSRARHHP